MNDSPLPVKNTSKPTNYYRCDVHGGVQPKGFEYNQVFALSSRQLPTAGIFLLSPSIVVKLLLKILRCVCYAAFEITIFRRGIPIAAPVDKMRF